MRRSMGLEGCVPGGVGTGIGNSPVRSSRCRYGSARSRPSSLVEQGPKPQPRAADPRRGRPRKTEAQIGEGWPRAISYPLQPDPSRVNGPLRGSGSAGTQSRRDGPTLRDSNMRRASRRTQRPNGHRGHGSARRELQRAAQSRFAHQSAQATAVSPPPVGDDQRNLGRAATRIGPRTRHTGPPRPVGAPPRGRRLKIGGTTGLNPLPYARHFAVESASFSPATDDHQDPGATESLYAPAP